MRLQLSANQVHRTHMGCGHELGFNGWGRETYQIRYYSMQLEILTTWVRCEIHLTTLGVYTSFTEYKTEVFCSAHVACLKQQTLCIRLKIWRLSWPCYENIIYDHNPVNQVHIYQLGPFIQKFAQQFQGASPTAECSMYRFYIIDWLRVVI